MRRFLILSLYTIVIPLTTFSQVSVGLRGGFNISAMRFESSGGQKSGGLTNGNQLKNLHADLLLNVPLSDHFHLQPVLRYLVKGTYFDPTASQLSSVTDTETGRSIRVQYFELPINILYKIPYGIRGSKVTLGGGPYVGYAVRGRYRSDIRNGGNVISHNSRTLKFDDEDNVMAPGICLNRWDAGANIDLGMELGGVMMIGVNYGMGMVNIDNSDIYKAKNNYVGVSVGILLNREDY